MHKTNRKLFSFVSKKALITFLISILAVFAIEPPAQADAISDARAELAATMSALDTAKKTLAAAEKELASAKSLAAKIDKELKSAQAAYDQVKA